MKHLICSMTLLAFIGCARVEYLGYRGTQEWPVGSSFVQSIDGIEVFEGLPNRPYIVEGIIDVYDDKPFYQNDTIKSKVMKMVKEHGADALIWLSDRVVSSGCLRMGKFSQDAASVDTGRSSQPEMIITNVSQNVATSYKKCLRSSLLLVKWKK